MNAKLFTEVEREFRAQTCNLSILTFTLLKKHSLLQ
ncbi:hypothetical protein VIBHAR_05470 [Vibrio campbellii ATCC BAA-1116]|uniref:Uncharacterized protein n=1 Tax=Vibrio campbellii (strain ATCC BAA-1116) TaxID=2902295 RepID=A7N2N3_VIBC1|nr:hypothetical protein VIBHAR_05470 [Vibrio campbellii ATCC BAA-1116]